MKQRVTIDIITDKPLDQMNNAIIVMDATKGGYIATTAPKFIAPIKAQLEELAKQVATLSTQFEQHKMETSQREIQLEERIRKEKQDFLATYKETNSKIIEMVKAFTNEGDNV